MTLIQRAANERKRRNRLKANPEYMAQRRNDQKQSRERHKNDSDYLERKQKRSQVSSWKTRGIKVFTPNGTRDFEHNDYIQALVRQNGLCVLSKKPPHNDKRLCADHCHSCGRFRGLLHDPINSALGKIGDTARAMVPVLAHLIGVPTETVEQRLADLLGDSECGCYQPPLRGPKVLHETQKLGDAQRNPQTPSLRRRYGHRNTGASAMIRDYISIPPHERLELSSEGPMRPPETQIEALQRRVRTAAAAPLPKNTPHTCRCATPQNHR